MDTQERKLRIGDRIYKSSNEAALRSQQVVFSPEGYEASIRAESLEAGKAREVAIGTETMITLIRTLGETYFLALAIRPDGNFGKGRFLMRAAAPKLLAELG